MYLLGSANSWVSDDSLFAPTSNEAFSPCHIGDIHLKHNEKHQQHSNMGKTKDKENGEEGNPKVKEERQEVQVKKEEEEDQDICSTVGTFPECKANVTEDDPIEMKYSLFAKELSRLMHDGNNTEAHNVSHKKGRVIQALQDVTVEKKDKGPSAARLPDESGSNNANKHEGYQCGDALAKIPPIAMHDADTSLLRHLPFLSYVFPTNTVANDNTMVCTDNAVVSNESTVCNDVLACASEFTQSQAPHMTFHLSKRQMRLAKRMEKREKRRKSKLRSLTCDTCNTKFKRIEHLLAHKGERKNKLHCTVCDTWFTCLKIFGKHKRTHANLKCDKCDKTFNTLAGHKLHGATHWDVKPHQCETCGKSFAYQGHLKTHLILHSGDYQFHCETCDKRFKSMGSMMKHKHAPSAHKSSFTCGECGKVFKWAVSLKRHHNIHHIKNAKRFPCDTCHMSFSQKASLTRHQKVSCVESTE